MKKYTLFVIAMLMLILTGCAPLSSAGAETNIDQGSYITGVQLNETAAGQSPNYFTILQQVDNTPVGVLLRGTTDGELYVVIYVEEDKIFTRRGQDLVIVADVSIVQAILGAKIEVPTLDEPVTLEIPKGTQSGKILRIKGMGLPHLGSTQKGDLLVEVSVRIPSKVTKRQEELLREFDKLEESRPLNKVKDFFKKAMGD